MGFLGFKGLYRKLHIKTEKAYVRELAGGAFSIRPCLDIQLRHGTFQYQIDSKSEYFKAWIWNGSNFQVLGLKL